MPAAQLSMAQQCGFRGSQHVSNEHLPFSSNAPLQGLKGNIKASRGSFQFYFFPLFQRGFIINTASLQTSGNTAAPHSNTQLTITCFFLKKKKNTEDTAPHVTFVIFQDLALNHNITLSAYDINH